MSASFAGHFDVVKLLLEKRSNVNAKNGRGETALMKAALKGHEQIVQLLLDGGWRSTPKTITATQRS